MQIRLQKRIAQSGHCSRRKAEVLIEEGKVSVNGSIISKLGSKVLESDLIEIDGKTLTFKESISIAINKPGGLITSKGDPHHSRTIMNLLPNNLQHLKPAGRLDKESEGLLILSSDGALIQKLTHPKHGHTKTYEVLVKHRATEDKLLPLKSREIKLDGYTLNPMEFEIINHDEGRTWLRLTLNEGRKRQIRRIMDSLGFPVIYLKRVAIGKLSLSGLKKGDYKILSEEELNLALS